MIVDQKFIDDIARYLLTVPSDSRIATHIQYFLRSFTEHREAKARLVIMRRRGVVHLYRTTVKEFKRDGRKLRGNLHSVCRRMQQEDPSITLEEAVFVSNWFYRPGRLDKTNELIVTKYRIQAMMWIDRLPLEEFDVVRRAICYGMRPDFSDDEVRARKILFWLSDNDIHEALMMRLTRESQHS